MLNIYTRFSALLHHIIILLTVKHANLYRIQPRSIIAFQLSSNKGKSHRMFANHIYLFPLTSTHINIFCNQTAVVRNITWHLITKLNLTCRDRAQPLVKPHNRQTAHYPAGTHTNTYTFTYPSHTRNSLWSSIIIMMINIMVIFIIIYLFFFCHPQPAYSLIMRCARDVIELYMRFWQMKSIMCGKPSSVQCAYDEWWNCARWRSCWLFNIFLRLLWLSLPPFPISRLNS